MKLPKYALGLALSALSLTVWVSKTDTQAATLSNAEQILAEQARLFSEAGYRQALAQQNAEPRF